MQNHSFPIRCRKMLKVLFLFSVVLVAAKAAPTVDDGIQLRIYGGSDAKVDEFPYMVSLRDSCGHFCGGSILNPRTIITAAHCFEKRPNADDIKAVVGSIYMTSGGTEYQISKIISHPEYKIKRFHANDVAVLITSEPISTSHSVGFIALPSTVTGAGVNLTMTGWGRTEKGRGSPNNLKKITLTTISNDDCNKKQDPRNDPILPTNICTLTKAGEGLCFGDSGGPLVDGKYLVGIASYVTGPLNSSDFACASGTPDAYTRISSYIPWINDNTQS